MSWTPGVGVCDGCLQHDLSSRRHHCVGQQYGLVDDSNAKPLCACAVDRDCASWRPAPVRVLGMPNN